VRDALDRQHLATSLRGELRALMEKGRVYPLKDGGELVAWGVRYLYIGLLQIAGDWETPDSMQR